MDEMVPLVKTVALRQHRLEARNGAKGRAAEGMRFLAGFFL